MQFYFPEQKEEHENFQVILNAYPNRKKLLSKLSKQKDKDHDLFSFARVVARVLKKYIEDGAKPAKKICENCGAEDTLIYQEGCVTCTSCGFGKCG